MQKWAYQLKPAPAGESLHDAAAPAGQSPGQSIPQADRCGACGEELFASGSGASYSRCWGVVWEILTLGNGEAVCGSCGEYLKYYFNRE